jgi:hypothetical protein
MADENKMFGNNDSSSNNQNVSPEEAMKLLVGDNAKYKSVEEMAVGMLHAQSHITTIEQENADLRDSTTKAASLKEVLEAIKGENVGTTTTSDDDPVPADKQTTGSTTVDVATQVEELLNKRAAADSASANFDRVQNVLKDKLGDRAGEVYSSVGKSLGVNLDDLSKSSPDAVIALVAGTPASSAETYTPPGTRSVDSSSSGEMTYKRIQQLFKEGKIAKSEKFKIENEQLSKLGKEKFWS